MQDHTEVVTNQDELLDVDFQEPSDLAELFGVNEALESAGKWFKAGHVAEVRIARMDNPRYRALQTQLFIQYAGSRRGGRYPQKVLEMIQTRLIKETIVKDWKNVCWEGKSLEFTPDNVDFMLTKQPFREWVSDKARDLSAFQSETDKADEGNS